MHCITQISVSILVQPESHRLVWNRARESLEKCVECR